MRELINEEMKDMKAANCQFGFEIERNQNLFRQLQAELLMTIEEKKLQNEAILENVGTKHDKEVKVNKRSGSVSFAKQNDTSVSSLLPTLKSTVEGNNNKLTMR